MGTSRNGWVPSGFPVVFSGFPCSPMVFRWLSSRWRPIRSLWFILLCLVGSFRFPLELLATQARQSHRLAHTLTRACAQTAARLIREHLFVLREPPFLLGWFQKATKRKLPKPSRLLFSWAGVPCLAPHWKPSPHFRPLIPVQDPHDERRKGHEGAHLTGRSTRHGTARKQPITA